MTIDHSLLQCYTFSTYHDLFVVNVNNFLKEINSYCCLELFIKLPSTQATSQAGFASIGISYDHNLKRLKFCWVCSAGHIKMYTTKSYSNINLQQRLTAKNVPEYSRRLHSFSVFKPVYVSPSSEFDSSNALFKPLYFILHRYCGLPKFAPPDVIMHVFQDVWRPKFKLS